LIFGTMGGESAGSVLRFLPLVLVGSLGSLLTAAATRRASQRASTEAQRAYEARIDAAGQRLAELAEEQRQILEERHPGPEGCVALARAGSPRLGERRPADEDFLCLRLGRGDVAPTFQLETSGSDDEHASTDDSPGRAHALRRAYAALPGAPTTKDLRRVGFLGIVGERNDRARLAQALWIECAVFHWPADLRMWILTGEGAAGEWTDLRAIPHVDPRGEDGARPAAHEALASLLSLVERRADVADNLAGHRPPASPALPAHFVVIDPGSCGLARQDLDRLLEAGPGCGVYGVVLDERIEDLPQGCGAIAACSRDQIEVIDCRESGVRRRLRPDDVDPRQVRSLAEAFRRAGLPRPEPPRRFPDVVSLLSLFGCDNPSGLPVEEWWGSTRPDGSLRFPIGVLEGGARLVFDLNDGDLAHGPHGLIGGMTGSGKSELLKAMLLSLALTHSPRRVSFALVDYKGGAAFAGLTGLPHTLGVVTDIEGHASYAERVIQCLTGEAERRKRLLEAARLDFGLGRAHIDDLWNLPVHPVLPRLLVVFDEFAEFRQRHPVESRRLISLARQGRSLGIHLILATQNIAAAVDPEIRQNISFLICLRVAESSDSQHLIGRPDAVDLPRGRGFLKAHGIQLFQSAYSGEKLPADSAGEESSCVTVVHPGGRRERRPRATVAMRGARPTEAEAVVARILAASAATGMADADAAWPPPLPVHLTLPDVLAERGVAAWDGRDWPQPLEEVRAIPLPILGLADRPLERRQDLVTPPADQGEGHVIVLGAAGTGKSTALRTAAVSLAMRYPPDVLHLYVLDLAGQPALRRLEGLPHVAAVVQRGEEERIERLMRWLQAEVERRTEIFRRARIDHWRDLPGVDAGESLPALYVLVDSIGEARRSPVPDLARRLSSLIHAAPLGIYLAASAATQSDLPGDLFASVSFRLSLHQPDASEYVRTVGRPSESRLQEEQNASPPSGRGYLRGNPPLEVQIALPVRGQTDLAQLQGLEALASAMHDSWSGACPEDIPVLGTWIVARPSPAGAPQRVDSQAPDWVQLGVEYETLDPAGLGLTEDGPMFLVAGAGPRSGKTTVLRTWILQLAEQLRPSDVQFLLCDIASRTLRPLADLPHCFGYLSRLEDLASAVERVQAEAGRRRAARETAPDSGPVAWPWLILVVDDFDVLSATDDGLSAGLREAFARARHLRLGCILSGNAADLPRDFDDPLIARVRRGGSGVLLGAAEGLEQFNNARRPSGAASSGLPAGRGYLIRRGRVDLIQACHFAEMSRDQGEELRRRVAALSAGGLPCKSGRAATCVRA
jgi:S-DNA-T family DNA segregation ATPase FtsK/SpoIIIE